MKTKSISTIRNAAKLLNQPVTSDESGVALLMTLVITMLLLGLGIALSTNSMFEVQVARNDERQLIAFYAAETGIERAVDAFRTSYTTATIPADGAVLYDKSAVSYSGSTVTADYTVSLRRRDAPAGSPLAPFPIYYTVQSVGREVAMNPFVSISSVVLNQTLAVSPRTLANYALFYDQFAAALSFSNFFRLTGRLAVNDLAGVAVSTNTRVNGDFYAAGNITGGPPVVSGNITENAGQIPFPTTATPFSSGATVPYSFTGTTRLIFFADGTVTIYNGGIAGGSKHVALPGNGLIAVTGDAIVEGTVNGRCTVSATDDVMINGNIRYADQSTNSWDTLGLVAAGDIVIPRYQYTATTSLTAFEPIYSGATITGISGGSFGATPIPPTGSDVWVDATLVSLTGGSNGIVDPNNRPPGYFHIYGNTIGKKAVQTIRTTGAGTVLANGLSMDITENQKLDIAPPPGFPIDTKITSTFFAFREVRSNSK